MVIAMALLSACSQQYVVQIPPSVGGGSNITIISGSSCPDDTLCYDVSTIYAEQITYNYSNNTNEIIWLGVTPI